MLSFDIKKQDLLEIVTQAFERGSLASLSLLVGHNEVAKTFTPSDLRYLEQAVLLGVEKNSELYDLVICGRLYVKRWGAGTFINRLPFAYTHVDKDIVRSYLSGKFFHTRCLFPHVLDENKVKDTMQGWRLVNRFGRQDLPKLKQSHVLYDIITKPENVSFYKLQHPTSVVRTYSDFYHLRAFHFEK